MSEIVYLAGGHGSPEPPTALAAKGGGALQWTASATPAPAGTATYYLVKRSATPGKGYVAIAPFHTSTSFTDATAEPGKTWHYVVTALNTGGESVPSNEAAVTLPAK
jgi:fibronectin type 3 domain-containing protein